MAELEAILERCRLGDDLAWEALVRRYQSRVYAVALHYMRDATEARDMAQPKSPPAFDRACGSWARRATEA